MVVTDPIADMLTQIRNALIARHNKVEIPFSKVKKSIADILLEEGYIKSIAVKEMKPQSKMLIDLKYGPNGEKVITGLRRISKPGLRIYRQYTDMPKVLNGMGIAIISTSKGLMTDKKARETHTGGEVLAYVW